MESSYWLRINGADGIKKHYTDCGQEKSELKSDFVLLEFYGFCAIKFHTEKSVYVLVNGHIVSEYPVCLSVVHNGIFFFSISMLTKLLNV